MDGMRAKSKQAVIQWLDGFREACCLHRVVIFCFRSKQLSIRTGQCFLLNGFIFLGSIFVLNSVVIPILQSILPNHCQQYGSEDPCSTGRIIHLYAFLRHGLVQFFYIFWFYPLYVLSFVLSNIWYNDVAKYAYFVMGKDGASTDQPNEAALNSNGLAHVDRPAGLGGIIIGIGEQVYSVLLLNFFFVQILAAGFIPYIGNTLSFLLHSWMYAYYCYEYKWNLDELALDKRLDVFESNWAFFAGFATGSRAEKLLDSEKTRSGEKLGRLPIFYLADTLSMRGMKVLSFLLETPQAQEEKKDI